MRLRAAFEWRRTESNGFNDPTSRRSLPWAAAATPRLDATAANGGFAGLHQQCDIGQELSLRPDRSLTSLNEAFRVLNSRIRSWSTPQVPNNRHWRYQNEISAYFKDDWKFRPDLTLNVGVHWEYYGMPYEHDGLRLVSLAMRMPSRMSSAPVRRVWWVPQQAVRI